MLRVLKNIFRKKTVSEPDIDDLEDFSLNNPNFLTDSDRIFKLLKDIEDASPLCTINFEGTTEEFSSSILDVQLENKQIILDELIPEYGNEFLINKGRLKLSTLFNGIGLSFKLTDIKVGSSRGIAYYKAAIPPRIYYPQRRSSLRVPINSLNIPFSGIATRTQASVGGYIFDLSRTGIGIATLDKRLRIQRGDSIHNCQIILEDSTVNFDMTVRFVKTNKQGTSRSQIGGYFSNISSKSQIKIEHIVVALEREEIRKRKR